MLCLSKSEIRAGNYTAVMPTGRLWIMHIRKSKKKSDKFRGGSFRFLKVRAHENDEDRLTTRENRLNIIQTTKVLEKQRIVRLC